MTRNQFAADILFPGPAFYPVEITGTTDWDKHSCWKSLCLCTEEKQIWWPCCCSCLCCSLPLSSVQRWGSQVAIAGPNAERWSCYCTPWGCEELLENLEETAAGDVWWQVTITSNCLNNKPCVPSDPVTRGSEALFLNSVPHAKHVVVKGAGHFLQESHGELLSDNIITFLKEEQ